MKYTIPKGYTDDGRGFDPKEILDKDNSDLVNVTFDYQHYQCDDGCCDEYWYDCYLNEDKLPDRYGEPSDAIGDILRCFGINNSVDFVYGDEEIH